MFENFLHPERAHLFWLLPILGLGFLWQAKIRRLRLQRLLHARNQIYLVPQQRRVIHVLRSLLLFVTLAAAVFALMQPRFGFTVVESPSHGSDIAIVFDVSQSMLVADSSPTRLDQAKRKVFDLLGYLKGDRVALIPFAGASFVRCPLTSDLDTVRLFLEDMSTDLISYQGTAIGSAIDLGVEMLTKYSQASQKLIVILSDGDDPDRSALAAAGKVGDKGISLVTIGVGTTDGGPVPDQGGGIKKDANGNLVISKLEEARLQQLAQKGGGQFLRASIDDSDLRALVDMIGQGRGTGVTQQKVWNENYFYLAAIAAGTLLLELGLSWIGWRVVVSMGLVLLGASVARDVHAESAEARKAFETHDYATSSRLFQKDEIDKPDDPRHTYNKGVSLYLEKKFAEAAEAFEKAGRGSHAEVQPGNSSTNSALNSAISAHALFNLGNTHVALGDFDAAIKDYEDVLKINPDDKQAQENLEWTKKQREQKNQNQQPQPQDKQQEQQPKQENQKPQENSQPGEKQESQQGQNPEKSQAEKSAEKTDQTENKDQDKQDQQGDGSQKTQPKSADQEQQSAKDQQALAQPDKDKEKGLDPEQARAILRSIQGDQKTFVRPRLSKPQERQTRDW